MFDVPVKPMNFEIVLPSQASAGEDTLLNPASSTHEPKVERDIEGPAAFAVSRLSFGKTIGIACISVTSRTSGRKAEIDFLNSSRCMASFPR